MTVSTIASLATGITRSLNTQNNRYAESVRSLVAGDQKTFSSGDIAKLSVASQLQNQVASIRAASQNLAAASSLLDVADGGAAQVARALDRMRDLTTRANNGSLNAQQRAGLDAEFQSLRGEINRIANGTSFGGQKLLDGSLALGGEKVGGTSLNLSIDSFLADDLLGGDTNLLTADGAAHVADAVHYAQQTVTAQRADFAGLTQSFDYASATFETAVQNLEAARSTLTDDDLFGDIQVSNQAQFQAQATASLLAQTNKLPGNILSLLNE